MLTVSSFVLLRPKNPVQRLKVDVESKFLGESYVWSNGVFFP